LILSFYSEFQERQFETCFTNELGHSGFAVWSPGQTEEYFLGFDGATWLPSYFLSRMKFPGFLANRPLHLLEMLNGPPGIVATSEYLNDWIKLQARTFPPKAFNFFVQHKRPKQTTQRGVCGEHWGQAYFEFGIDKHQQRRLQSLEDKLGKNGVVTYSCPSFLKTTDLWGHVDKHTVLDNTNFVGASKLSGHSRYSFIDPGHTGFANPEPSIISDSPIQERLSSAAENSDETFGSQIRYAAKCVESVMYEEQSSSSILYSDLVRRASEQLSTLRIDFEGRGSYLSSLLKVSAFCVVNVTSWALLAKE
jgi:hypothetical protein